MTVMNLNFLVDVGVGKSIEDFLIEQGFDIKSVRTINPRMSDQEILKIAASEDRIIITMDKDFGELVYHSFIEHSGVILLRLEDATGDEKLEVIKKIISNHTERIKGNFCVFQRDKFRIRNIIR
jgi:predicted nuclease of predicted toxin-antitoxin system